ncbi:MAG: hypothetical protein KDE19_17525 [Caldilineaceae bacterium]|nr:hypothetical protein [Caldilineaceae bacterium]
MGETVAHPPAHETNHLEQQIHYSGWIVLSVLGAFIFSLSMLIVGWLAWVVEGDQSAPYVAGIWLVLAGGLGYLLATLPRAIGIEQGSLTLHWWWHTEIIAVDTVTAVSGNGYNVTLATGNNCARFSFLFPNQAAHLLTFLETHIPIAAAAKDARIQQDLPLVLRPRLTAPFLMGGMGILMAGIGLMLIWYTLQSAGMEPWLDRIGMALMGLLMLAVGGVLLTMVLTGYTWVITFDPDQVTLRRTFGRQIYSARAITQFELITEERTIKGFVHQIYQLRLHFMDGTQLDIAPNLPSFPMDYAGADELRRLSEAKTMLERQYAPVVAEDIDPELFPELFTEERWGSPQAARQWAIGPYDLTVYRLDYGEHHAAASTVHILIDHVEAGTMRFRTTNGELHISPNGRYLILFDATLLLAFNLATGRTYHRNSRRGWLYYNVWLDGEMLCCEEMQRTNSQARAVRKPISLEQPTSALRRGFGSAGNGDFPSAYG